jgi:DNA-binding MarR family transcriptional regulator
MASKSKKDSASSSSYRGLSQNFSDILANPAIRAQFSVTVTSKLIDDLYKLYLGKDKYLIEVLSILAINNGGLTPTELSKYTFLSRQVISQIIKTMEQEELVERRRITNNNKAIQVILTDLGWAFVEKRMPTYKTLADTMATIFDDEEEAMTLCNTLKDVRKKIYKIKASLQQYVKQDGNKSELESNIPGA